MFRWLEGTSYGDVIDHCDSADRTRGGALWGYIYGSTWVPSSGLIRNEQPRPAMTWLMTYLGR